jgi:hypothetical protein
MEPASSRVSAACRKWEKARSRADPEMVKALEQLRAILDSPHRFLRRNGISGRNRVSRRYNPPHNTRAT